MIRALFTIPGAEYVVIGLKGLLDKNRDVVKDIFYEMDDERIMKFLTKNAYALGLSNQPR